MNMKQRTFKALLLSVILLCSITDLFAQDAPRDLYWIPSSTDLNFDNYGSWSTTADYQNQAGSPPTQYDNVYFLDPPIGEGRIIVTDGVANMATLKVAVPGYSFGNATYNIHGDIDVHDSFEIETGQIILKNASGSPRDVFINLGGITEKRMGWQFHIQKDSYKVDLQSPLNIPNTELHGFFVSEFNSNANFITSATIQVGSMAATRKIDFSGIEVTTGDATFHTNNTTINFAGSHIKIKNSYLSFPGTPPSGVNVLNDVTMESPIRSEINGSALLEVNNIFLKTPYIRMISESPANSFNVKNNLSLLQPTTILLGADYRRDLTLNVNNVSSSYVGCGVYSLIEGVHAGNAIVKVTGAPITAPDINLRNVHFSSSGSAWRAPGHCNIEDVTGNIDWLPSNSAKICTWIGGSESWHEPSNWSTNCVPTIIDDVIINSSSFGVDGQEITLAQPAFCKNITWTDGSRKGSLNKGGLIEGNIHVGYQLTIAGSANFAGVKEYGIQPDLIFIGSGSITSAQGVTYASERIIFKATGTYTLMNDFISGISGQRSNTTVFHRAGGLDVNGKTIKIGSFISETYKDLPRTFNLKESSIYICADQMSLDYKGGELTYDFTDSHIYFFNDVSAAGNFTLRAVDSESGSHHSWSFNKVSSLNTNNTALLYFQFGENDYTIKDLTLNSNFACENTGFIVDNMTISANKTYVFASLKDTEINNSFTVNGGACDIVTISGSYSSNPANLNANFSPFHINSAKVKDIKAGGTPLVVSGGINEGGNIYVTITPRQPQTFYWVPKNGSGTGHWSDAGHWSIGPSSSGVPASITNLGGCVPSIGDIVIFDENSFVGEGEILTMDVNIVTLESMFWRDGVNIKKPVVSGNTCDITITGSVELAKDMTGEIGVVTILTSGSHEFKKYDTGGLRLGTLASRGGAGRLDISSDLYNIGQTAIGAYHIYGGPFHNGFYTNNYDLMTDGSFGFNTLGEVDLGSSHIKGWSMNFVVNAGNAGFVSSEADLDASGGGVSINNFTGNDVLFDSIAIRSLNTGNNGLPFSVKTNYTGLSANSEIIAMLETDVLEYKAIGVHMIEDGYTVTINDTVMGSGGLCSYSVLTSRSGLTLGAGKATIKSGKGKDLRWQFFDVKNIIGDNTYSNEYRVVGSDQNNNENFIFESAPAAGTVRDLGKITLNCNAPYLFRPMPGVPYRCAWYKRDRSLPPGFTEADRIPGYTGDTYYLDDAARYMVIAYYEESNTCNLSFEIEVEGVTDNEPPIFIQRSDTVVYGYGGNYSAKGIELDAVAIDCNVNRYWYYLSGATTSGVIYNTLDGVVLNEGVTTIICYANDTIPARWLNGNPAPTPNVSAPMVYNVTAVRMPDNVVDADCTIEPVASTFTIREVATFGNVHSMATPLVADLDGDGVPEIIAPKVQTPAGHSHSNGFVIANVRANTSYEINTVTFATHGQSVAIADVDSDGTAEIFVQSTDTRIYCYTPSGVAKPGFSTTVSTGGHYIISLADINNDGTPELIVGPYIFNAKTGALLLQMTFEADGTAYGNPHAFPIFGHAGYYFMPVVGDVDGDGVLEIAAGSTVYYPVITNTSNQTGNTYTTKKVNTTGVDPAFKNYLDGPTVLVDFDNDGQLDVCVIGYSKTKITTYYEIVKLQFYAWNPRTQKVIGYGEEYLDHTGVTIPYVGDLDGNGYPDIAFSLSKTDGNSFSGRGMTSVQYDASQPTKVRQGPSKAEFAETSGFTLFDFNQDGKSEIVYRGTDKFYIVDGTTLTDLSPPMTAYSGTIAEYPIVADVDGDGQAEIILTRANVPWIAGGNLTGVVAVYKSANHAEPWAPARPVWNQWAYNSVHINDDMTVPRYPISPAMAFSGNTDTVRPFNGFLQQQTILDKDGLPFWPAPNAEADKSSSSIDVLGNNVIINACFKNTGDATLVAPLFVTAYAYNISAANILKVDSVNAYLDVNDSICVTVVIPKDAPLLSNATYIVVRINDKGHDFPYHIECEDSDNVISFVNPLLMKKDATLLLAPEFPDFDNRGTYPNPVSVLSNERIEYRISAVNATSNAATIIITDIIPAYLEYISGSASSPSPVAKTIDDTGSTTAPPNPVRQVITWTFFGVPSGSTVEAKFMATPQLGSVASQPLFINNAMVTIVDSSNDSIHFQTNSTFHQGAGVSITTFSAGLGGSIYNATEQALDYKSTPKSGVIITPEDGYVFAGWSHENYVSLRGVTVKAQENIMLYDTLTVYGNVELHANFELEEYPVSYYLNGSMNAASNPGSYTIESRMIALEEPQKAGDTFIGWTGSNGDEPQQNVVIPKGSIGERIYYANFLRSGREDITTKSSESEDKAWAVENDLFIMTSQPGSIVRIYSTEGVLREQHTIVSSGITSRKLSRGIYVITINNNIGHKVRIE